MKIEAPIVPTANTNPHAVYGGQPSALTIEANEVIPRPIDFLATNRLFASAINSFIGDPSAGKSLLLAKVTAAITTGQPLFPDDFEEHKPGRVIYMTNEDDLATF